MSYSTIAVCSVNCQIPTELNYRKSGYQLLSNTVTGQVHGKGVGESVGGVSSLSSLACFLSYEGILVAIFHSLSSRQQS